MTIIEIRPFRNGWKCFEAPGVEPVFLDQEQAIDYAKCRACFRSGEIRILKPSGDVERIIPFDETGRKL
jgi:methyl coenzyme M reductase alpha subunit